MNKSVENRIFEVALFLLLLVLVVVTALLVLGRDIHHEDDADLFPELVELADDENAYTYFAAAAAKLVWDRDTNTLYRDFKDGKSVAEDEVDQIIHENSAVFPLIEQGAACTQFASPQTVSFLDKSMSEAFAESLDSHKRLRLIWLLHLKCYRHRLNQE